MTTSIKPTETTALYSPLEQTPRKSQLFKPAMITAISVAGLVALLATNPGGWVLSALGIALVITGFIAIIGANIANYMCKTKFEKQKMSFEVSTICRMMPWVTNYNEISLQGLTLADGKPIPEGAILYVGALPNKYRPGNTIPPNVTRVLANNQEFEVNKLGPSNPLTAQDWAQRGAIYLNNEAEDHALLKPDQMDLAADFLAPAISAGEAALSHCRGGAGRSATSAAAFMMKHLKKADGQFISIEEICARIKAGRKKSTIWNKMHALRDYDEFLKQHGIARPARNPDIDLIADSLRD